MDIVSMGHNGNGTGHSEPTRKWGYALIATVLLVIVFAFVGWQKRSAVLLTSIEVVSACESEWRLFTSTVCPDLNSTPEEITRLVALEPGTPLYDADPAAIVDRVERHPWIASADMERTLGGRLILTITERTPVLLVMRNGQPRQYIDAEGYPMPFVTGVAYDVPLLHGLSENFVADRPVNNGPVLELAGVLGDLDSSIHALLSEIEVQSSGALVLHTTVLDSRGSIEVRVGAGSIRQQLDKLHAFWHQALLPEPGRNVLQIDLRFDSQIVTR